MMDILGWILLPVVGGIIAIISGHLAKKEIRQSEGLATAGLVLGYANLVLGLCGCLVIIILPALFAGVMANGNQIFNAVP